MSTTSATSAATWSPRQVRKSRYIVAFGVIVAIAALWACGQAWIAMSMSGTPTCDPTPPSPVTAITAAGTTSQISVPDVCATGWQLQAAATNAQLQAAVTTQFGPAVSMPTPFPQTYGVPSIVMWAVVAGLVLAVGGLMRNALVLAAAVIPWQMGQSSFASTTRNIVGALDPSQYAFQQGWNVLGLLGPVTLLVVVVSVVLVAKTNHAVRKAAASQSGKPAVLGALRDFAQIITRGVMNPKSADIDADVHV